ncbi:MAG: MlaD family protein [Pseudomonadota bacterium]
MSKRASPTLIGAFVVGAIALVVIALLVFGSGRFFSERITRVAYFPGSVKGLRVGAPVNFRGVTIGEVIDIQALFNERDRSMLIPVIIEILPDRINVIDPVGEYIGDQDELDDLIQRGLRAQLQVDSLVTGLLSVDLDLYPDTPIELIQVASPEFEDLLQIPTIPSTMEELEQSVGAVMQEIPILLKDVRELLQDVMTGETGANIEKILVDVQQFTDGLDKAGPTIKRLLGETEETVVTIKQVAETADRILTNNDQAIDATISNLQETIGAARRMVDQVNLMIAENRQGLRDFSETGLYEITGLAQDAQRMVNQITRVAEQLERDPARFFLGDRGQGVRAE